MGHESDDALMEDMDSENEAEESYMALGPLPLPTPLGAGEF